MTISDGVLESLRSDIAFKQTVVKELAATIDEWTMEFEPEKPDEMAITAIAANLARFYTGVEDLVEQILKVFDDFQPAGGDWHVSLLNAATITKEIRPPILSRTTYNQLDNLRRFRHIFHKIYTKPLDWEQMRVLVTNIKDTLNNFLSDLNQFDDFVRQSIQNSAQPNRPNRF